MEEKLNRKLYPIMSKQRQLSFLLKLSDTLHLLANPPEIEEAGTKLALQFLGADRCHYSTIEGDHAIIAQDALRGNLPSVSGIHLISSFTFYKAVLDIGQPIVVEDVRTSNIINKDLKKQCLRSKYESFINVPVIKNGKTVGLLSVVQVEPRKWTKSEMQLTMETAERIWAAVEKAKSEEALRKSADEFRTLFYSVDVGFSIVEVLFDNTGEVVDYIFLEMNAAHEALSGVTRTVIGKRIKEFMPNIEESLLKRAGEIALTGQSIRYEQYISTLNRWFDVHSSRVGGDGSRKVAFVIRDITERKLAEQKIQESEERYSTIIDASGLGLWDFDVLAKKVVAAGRMHEIYGLASNDEYTLEQAFKSIHPQDIEEQNRVFASIMAGNVSSGFETEYRIIHKASSEVRWIRAKANAVFQNGDLIRTFGTVTDITERRKTEESLSYQKSILETVTQNTDMALFLMDEKQFCVYMNEAAESMTGFTLNELKGKQLHYYIHHTHPDGSPFPLDDCPIDQAFPTRNRMKGEEVFVHKNGTFFPVLFTASPILVNGNAIGTVIEVKETTEDKQREEELKESEKRFRTLADESPIFVFIISSDPLATVSYWNKTWLNYSGQSGKEAEGKAWDHNIHPDDLPLVRELFASVFTAQQPFFIPAVRTKRHDGVYRWHAYKGNPKFLANGEFDGYVGVGFDVHEQKLAEEKLAYRTALLEAHKEASVDGILMVDLKGKIISFNQRFIQIWNMPQHVVDAKDDDAALSFAMAQLVDPQSFIDKVKYLYDHPTETSLDELEFSDGKIVERNGYPVIGNDGKYYAWSWTFRDITRQKHYETKIKESESRFRTLAETLPQLVWMTDEKGTYEYASNQWFDYSGLDCFAEDTWGKIVHPDDMDSLMNIWESSLVTGEDYHAEVRLRNKAGAYRWHMVQGEPIRNEKGTISKWIGAFTDIENFKEEQKLKDDFLSMASHELKTPVTTIKAYGQIIERLLQEKDDAQTLSLVKKMSTQVGRLTTLISDLLDVTKMRKGGLMRNESVFNFDHLINDVIDDMRKIIVTHQVIDHLDADITILGDKDKVGQVLNNLISNASKYSPGAAEIIVRTKIVNDGVQLSVEDFGIGISKVAQKNVFKQFYRVTGDNQCTFPGMGIGLYICAEIIKREAGKIWVESAAGKGSVFYVWLPLYH